MVTDPITGLANSRGIMESMISYLEELWRRNVNFVIMQVFVCEYEFFRKTCGEEAGDELLRRIGRVLEEIFGNNAVIGRITESQFFILMQYQKKGAAEEAADQINRKIQEIHEVGEWRPSCTAQVMFAYATADTISGKMYSEMIHKVMMELNEKEENDPEQESDRKAGK